MKNVRSYITVDGLPQPEASSASAVCDQLTTTRAIVTSRAPTARWKCQVGQLLLYSTFLRNNRTRRGHGYGSTIPNLGRRAVLPDRRCNVANVVDVKTALYAWMAFLKISKTALIHVNNIVTFTVSHLKLLKSVYHFEELKKIGFHWMNHQPFRDQKQHYNFTEHFCKVFYKSCRWLNSKNQTECVFIAK